MRAMPYFLENEKWYVERIDKDGNLKYELTACAPPEAVKSFEEYYQDPVFYDDDGNEMDLSGYSCYA